MKVPLKPCPFCGGPGYLKQTSPPSDQDTPAWYCGCDACNFHLKLFRIETWTQETRWQPVPDAKENAMAVWNKRAAPQPGTAPNTNP